MSSQQDTSPKRAWTRSSKIDFSPLPTTKPCPLNLWPITSPCPVLVGYRLVVPGSCACIPSMYVQNLPAGRSLAVVWRFAYIVCRPFLLTFYVSCFSISRSPEELGFIWYWVLYFFRSISWLPSFPIILLCHSYCNDLILLSLFRSAVYSFPQWLGMIIGFPTYGLLCPFCLPFGHPWPNFLILILGIHGLVINPLLSLFALLWACSDPFSLFYIIYCPWVCYFSLSGFL